LLGVVVAPIASAADSSAFAPGAGAAPDTATTPPPASAATSSAPQRGVVNYAEGHRYDGEHRDGTPHGRGTMSYPNRDRYDGEWRNGSRHGRGSMAFASGDKYAGEWRDDKMTGRGTMSWPNGDRYEGDFIDGVRAGRGLMVYADGGRYDGDWRNNEANGRGVMVWANGQRYEGQWVNGNRHGHGVQIAAPGKQHQGEWRDDTPVGEVAWSSGSSDSRSRSPSQSAQASAPPSAVASAPSSTAGGAAPATGTTASVTSSPSEPMPVFVGIRKRLAVLRLENKVKTPLPDATWQIGEGLTEMLTTELFRTGRFVMVERAALSDIVKEQELGQTGLIQKETITKVGELLGAQLLVAGAVTEFEASSSGGGGGLGFAGFALSVKTNSAHVAVDIRLVDAMTGQIVKSHAAEAKAEESGFAIAATRRGMQLGGDAFQKTPLGQATREAIAKAVKFIVSEMDRVPWTGRVVQAKGQEVIVNAGTNMNLRPGLALDAFAKGETLTDPATGVSLGSRDALVGTVTLGQVEERFSIGRFTGQGALKRGDMLKLK
jgi:curli biogenesis system outer membrane secretion channel CsgG